MRRLLAITSLSVVAWAAQAQQLLAQSVSGDKLPANWTGPGFYLNLFKMGAVWAIFALWVHSADWVSRDCQERGMNYMRWNPIVVGAFLGALVLLWLLPFFWVGLALLIVAYVAPLATYVVQRNRGAHSSEKVFTPSHIRYWLASRLKLVGVKVAAEKDDPHTGGPPVQFVVRGGATQRDDTANLLLARQTPGFRDARQLIYDGLVRRADAMMLDITPQGIVPRYMVDGVWHDGENQDHEKGDPAVVALRTVCGFNPEVRTRQQGGFLAEYEGRKYLASVTSQGAQSGERILIQFEGKKTPFKTLDELGMRGKMQEQLAELLQLPRGFVLITAPPANGLRTSTNVIIRSMDRFTREFMTVEDERNRYEEIENLPVRTYDSGTGEGPTKILPDVFLTEPNVVVVRDLVDADTVRMLCQEISRDRLMLGTLRAQDCAESLLRVLAMKVPPAEFSKGISGVINQRLIRKLCDHCKEAYVPDAQLLAQLGLPQDRAQVFYRPPQQRETPCEECQGIGYIGRTAFFELLAVGKNVREALARSPKLEAVRQAARKDGMRTLQEEGLVLVVRGETALAELTRVLKSQ
jgi:type II secretory ATPase GspE/PulE/Tfp pilus assembly ATPase PilB-like protein